MWRVFPDPITYVSVFETQNSNIQFRSVGMCLQTWVANLAFPFISDSFYKVSFGKEILHLKSTRLSNILVLDTDIHPRSQISYTALCNGVISHGAQIGGLRVFADHRCRNKCKTNVPTIFTCRAVFYACLSLRSDRNRCR